MVEITLQDEAARERIAHDLQTNIVVLAGAGAGKTYALVERMVNYVCQVRPEVDRIAAITFTRKAAGEMRGRFMLRLRERFEQAEGEEAARIQMALDRIDQCFVGTIHSFCGQLLRERPVEAGIPPYFAELDDRAEVVLRRRVWDEFVQLSYEGDDPRLGELEELGIQLADLHAFFGRRCEFSDLELKPGREHMPDLTEAVEQARMFIGEVEAHLPAELPLGPDAFMESFARLQRFLQYRDMETDRQRAEFLKVVAGLGKVTQKNWGEQKVYAKTLNKPILPEFQESVVEPALCHWRQYLYSKATSFIDDAVAHYEKERRKTGQLTFQDLLLGATRLLRETPDVRAYFQERYRCLFVDEFQDTDPIQAEMLFFLTGEDIGEMDWQRLEPRAGSLFIVGDEKQSIYRFRRADVYTFRLVGQRLEEMGGRIELLNTSFRSLGHFCDWVNTTFAPLFDEYEERYQAPFAPLLKFNPDGDDPFCVRKLSIGKVTGNNRHEIALLDAERIAAFIAAAIEGSTALNGETGALLGPCAQPGDFMILTYTRKELPTYARALEALGVPYDVVGGNHLGNAEEVVAFVDVLETLYAPDNTLALLTYLRGLLIGLGDDEFYAFRKAGGRFDYCRPVPEEVPVQVRARFEEAFSRLQRFFEYIQAYSPAVACERIMEDLGLPGFAVSKDMGSTKAGNLLRLLALIRQWESQGWHWGQIVEELQQMIADDEYEVEEMTLEAGQENVVRLMNIHQSKGLQAKVVFLADAGDRQINRDGVEFHVSRAGDTPQLSLPVSRPRGEYGVEVLAEPAGWIQDQEEERHYLEGEKLRLLYVATTRAEDLLVISHYTGFTTTGGSWSWLYPVLDAVPELEMASISLKKDQSVPLVSPDTLVEEVEGKWTAVKDHSYTVRPVTDDLVDDEIQVDRRWGRGRDYGSLVHRLFERAFNGTLPQEETVYIMRQLEDSGLDPQWAEPAQGALDGLRDSAIWTETRAAEALFTEVPIAASDEHGNIARGIIDMIYKISRGWTVVDFKTDKVAEHDIEPLAQHYAPQVDAYAKYWLEITGEAVVERGLWFTECNRWISVNGE